ncbi:MAG: serine--tRNA ligase [Planctomycetota bacterium]|nr:serine--tRNA ligase [Planctomycetota bacterium]
MRRPPIGDGAGRGTEMLDIKFIRENADAIRKAVAEKKAALDVDRLLAADEKRRRQQQAVEELRKRRNELSKAIPNLPSERKREAVEEVKRLKEELDCSEKDLAAVQAEFDELMLWVPNIPAPGVPRGDGERDNVELRRWGESRKFEFKPKDHVELAESLGLVNFEGPRRFAGGRSYALVGAGAMLELAILNFAMKTLVVRGFVPVLPPVLVRERAMIGSGWLPYGREESFRIERDELYLAGTSEVSLVSLHCDEILSDAELPKRYAGWSVCFRREAGAHGKDTRGLYRLHQFHKVEQVIIGRNDDAETERLHMEILSNAEAILQAIGIPYRVVLACTAEMGMGQVRKHEIESWMPSRNSYSETHSCSTLGEFQARRLNLRYRTSDGRLLFCHTLNNTAIASPRILIPILENFQNADGSVTVPQVLREYMGGIEKLEPVRRR